MAKTAQVTSKITKIKSVNAINSQKCETQDIKEEELHHELLTIRSSGWQFSKEWFKEKPRCPAGHYMERRTDNYYYNHWRCNSGLPKCKSFPGYDNYQNLFIECPKSECNFQVCKQCFKSLLGIETKPKATSGQCASTRMDGNLRQLSDFFNYLDNNLK